jgi:(p)ppGpp synthase/HD superfamily hydrolase
VAAIVSHAGLDETVVAAAILHDVIEDTDTTIDDLRESFSQEVCELVAAATEVDRSASWEARKSRVIGELGARSTESLCLVCADKIDNLESLAEQLRYQGEDAWRRFSRGREKQQWFYTSVLYGVRAAAHDIEEKANADRRSDPAIALKRLLNRLAEAVERVFPGAV